MTTCFCKLVSASRRALPWRYPGEPEESALNWNPAAQFGDRSGERKTNVWQGQSVE